MARSCTICSHPSRAEIDRRLTSGASRRGLARQYRVSKDALNRHMAHIGSAFQEAGRPDPRQLAEATAALMSDLDAAWVRQPSRTLDRAEWVLHFLRALFRKSVAGGQAQQAWSFAREIRGYLEFRARLTGELDPDVPQVGVTIQALVASITPSDEARVREQQRAEDARVEAEVHRRLEQERRALPPMPAPIAEVAPTGRSGDQGVADTPEPAPAEEDDHEREAVRRLWQQSRRRSLSANPDAPPQSGQSGQPSPWPTVSSDGTIVSEGWVPRAERERMAEWDEEHPPAERGGLDPSGRHLPEHPRGWHRVDGPDPNRLPFSLNPPPAQSEEESP